MAFPGGLSGLIAFLAFGSLCVVKLTIIYLGMIAPAAGGVYYDGSFSIWECVPTAQDLARAGAQSRGLPVNQKPVRPFRTAADSTT